MKVKCVALVSGSSVDGEDLDASSWRLSVPVESFVVVYV